MPERDPLRIVPLGGLGEFGLNCLVVERGDDAIAIDCGVMFPEEHMMGIDRVLPELAYLRALGDRLKAIVLTHGHEDHIGALPYVLADIGAPVFATPFTAALLERKLEEYPAARDAVIEKYDAGDAWKVGGLEVEGLRVTHSIVDSCALAVRAGRDLVIHTGDFKLDPDPVDGLTTDLERFRELGDEGVRVLLSDSTNAEVAGTTRPESAVPGFLRPIFAATKGRIYVTTFASHVHRIQNVVSVCAEFGRAIAFVGRSMEANASLATRTRHLRIPGSMLVSSREAEKLPRDKVCFMVTGSQGEPGSALARIALLQMIGLQVAPDDAVIFSSRAIPGNDRAISAVVNQLLRCGAEVYDTRVAEVHVSGHACRDELRAMIHMVRPEFFVPLHGEYRNLVHHSRLAMESGVPAHRCFTLVDGEVLAVDGGAASRAGTVEIGRVLVDGSGVGDVDEAVVRDRRHIAEDGVVTVILAIKRQTGEIVEGPDFVVRGLASPDEEAEAFEEARRVVKARILELGPAAASDLAELQEELRLATRRFFRRRFGRRPVVVPYVMEL